MFLNAILLESAVQFLPAENVPAVVNIACCTNMLNGYFIRDMSNSNACSGKNNCIVTQVITRKDDDKDICLCDSLKVIT